MPDEGVDLYQENEELKVTIAKAAQTLKLIKTFVFC